MRKNIVFDMGGVLLDFNPEAFCASLGGGADTRRIVFSRMFSTVTWLQMDRGLLSVEEGAGRILPGLPPELREACRGFMTGWFHDCARIAGMEALVRRLKAAGHGLYILSNAPDNYTEFRKYIPAIECFDGESYSCEHGLLKPDPAAYRHFFERFSLRAADCFFVDDMPANVEAALFAGMGGGFVRHAWASAADVEAAIEAWLRAAPACGAGR